MIDIRFPIMPGYSAFALVALTGASTASMAQPHEPTWRLAADFAVVNSSGDAVTIGASSARIDTDFDATVGAGLRLEYLFGEALALEVGVLGASGLDVAVGSASAPANVSSRIEGFAPVTLGLNYHFDVHNRVDLYVGPFLVAIRYGDIRVETVPGRVTTRESADVDFGWGVITGVNVPIRSGAWSLQGNVRYIRTKLSVDSNENSVESDFDPLIFSVGFGYRF